jgi:hypothetical protein
MIKNVFKCVVAFVLFFNAVDLRAAEGNPVKLVESSPNESVIKIDVSSFNKKPVMVGNTSEFVIETPYGVSIHKKGYPDLPKLTVSLIIPQNAEMTYEILSSKYTDYPNIAVAPSKGTVSRQVDIKNVPYTKNAVYMTNGFFPGNLAQLDAPYMLRDVQGQAVSFQPFQYNPVTKTLRVYEELTVRVFNRNAGKTSSAAQTSVDPNFMSIYQSQFLNSAMFAQSAPLSEQGKMLIICNDAYVAAMAPFVSWKKQIGIPTTIVAISAVGNTSTSIKSYVTNYYNTVGLAYLLIVGDAQHVTPCTFAASGDSDNGYGYIVGNDRYPDIIVGRMSAESVTDVNTQVNRSITYERNPSTNGLWYKRGMAIASNQGPGNDNQMDYEHERSIRNQLLAYTYTNIAEMYDGSQGVVDASGNPSPSMVGAEVNAGLGIINYTGHGSDFSWGTSGFSNTQINTLTNTNGWPFIISVACVNGNFKNQTCFAEAWLRAANGIQPTGAVATVMSTINQYWDEPMEGQDQMDTILCGAYANNIKRSFGGIVVNGLIKMNDYYNSSGMDMTDTWTIFGDPSIIVRTSNPSPMTVTHSTLELIGVTQLAVNCNKNDAIVCLSKQGNILGTGTIASGSVIISFPAINNIDSIDVTVTAYNCIPYFGKTQVRCSTQLITLNSSNVSICVGSSATLSASGANTYTWSTNSNAASIVVNPTTSTHYTVTGTLNNVCKESRVVSVTVNQLPNITFNQNLTNVCMGMSQVNLNGLPVGGIYSGNGVLGNNFNPNTAGVGSHALLYSYTDANTCKNTATVTMVVSACTGVFENTTNTNFNVYPNPAKDAITLKTHLQQDAQVIIYDALGNVVDRITVKQNSGSMTLETSEFARGVYFAKFKTADQTQVVKFILE